MSNIPVSKRKETKIDFFDKAIDLRKKIVEYIVFDFSDDDYVKHKMLRTILTSKEGTNIVNVEKAHRTIIGKMWVIQARINKNANTIVSSESAVNISSVLPSLGYANTLPIIITSPKGAGTGYVNNGLFDPRYYNMDDSTYLDVFIMGFIE